MTNTHSHDSAELEAGSPLFEGMGGSGMVAMMIVSMFLVVPFVVLTAITHDYIVLVGAVIIMSVVTVGFVVLFNQAMGPEDHAEGISGETPARQVRARRNFGS